MGRKNLKHDSVEFAKMKIAKSFYRELYWVPDKRLWGKGPWIHEPDLVQWLEWKGGWAQYLCVTCRNEVTGVWLGYVGIPKCHWMHGLDRHDEVIQSILSHYEINYSGRFAADDIRGDDRAADYWYFGFDCGHGFDYSPGEEYRLKEMEKQMVFPVFGDVFGGITKSMDVLVQRMGLVNFETLRTKYQTYKTLDYAKSVCGTIARQLDLPK